MILILIYNLKDTKRSTATDTKTIHKRFMDAVKQELGSEDDITAISGVQINSNVNEYSVDELVAANPFGYNKELVRVALKLKGIRMTTLASATKIVNAFAKKEIL